MKAAPYFVVLLLAVVCVVLSVALIFVADANRRLVVRIQTQQQSLGSGVLSQQGQQLSANVLQDMAVAAGDNAAIRALLQKHGYRLQDATGSAVLTNNTPPAAAEEHP